MGLMYGKGLARIAKELLESEKDSTENNIKLAIQELRVGKNIVDFEAEDYLSLLELENRIKDVGEKSSLDNLYALRDELKKLCITIQSR